jgi:hypothetical protein
LTEPRADLKTFLGGAIRSHGRLLGAGLFEAANFFRRSLKFPLLLPMLTKAASLRQITASRNFSNEVYENGTVISG